MVKKDEIPSLAARFAHPDFSSLKTTFNSQKAYSTTGTVTTDRPDDKIRQKMEALALEYLIDPTKNLESGKQAVTLAINYLSSFGSIGTSEVTQYDDVGYTNEMIIGAALVYDWCYPLMTADNKTKLRNAMTAVCKRTEYGLPSTSNTNYLSGHYSELNPTTYLAMGIAVFDEDPTYFNFAYNEQTKGFAPSRNFMFTSGTHHQGAQYIHVRHYSELLQHFMLSKVDLSPYTKDINTVTFRDIYGTTPQKTDMDGMPEGDCHNRLLMGYPQLYYLSATLSKDPYLQRVAKSKLSLGSKFSARMFIYYDPTIVSSELENKLCLTKYFPSPAGMMIARTKWDFDSIGYKSNVMVVLMNMKEYNAQNHTHLDGGHFGIYYKGHLALDAGIYQGSDAANGWGKVNYYNYYARTIAHNSLLIFDPNEPYPEVAYAKATSRDGGQFFFSASAWKNSSAMISAGKSSQILAHDIATGANPEYSYMKGDLTKTYNVPSYISTYAAKVDTVRRSFVFLNHGNDKIPGSLIVLDKVVSTKATFKKTWLLHTQNQPTVSGNTIVATTTTNSRNGKLSTTVLLPETNNQSIVLVGGAGKEYWVDGKNYGTVTQEDAGMWRVELSPKTEAKSDNFLTVLQACDATNTEGLSDIAKVYSDDSKYVVTMVKDRIVAQQLQLGATNDKVNFTIGNSATNYKVLVTDLKAGSWTVNSPSGQLTLTATSTAGTLYFTSKGGAFKIQLGVTATHDPQQIHNKGNRIEFNAQHKELVLNVDKSQIGTNYVIRSLSGAVIQSGIIRNQTHIVPMNKIARGVYFLNFKNTGNKPFKIINF
jgi:heparin/heparan-sulfate lyase